MKAIELRCAECKEIIMFDREQNRLRGPIIKLTGLGEFVAAYGVMTDASWWRKQIKEIEKLRDQDYGFDELMDERSRGFAMLMNLFRDYGSPEHWPTHNRVAK